ncbi:MIP/aquaporin family protein [Promicromonospora sukumoe]|uniref:Glycerol uptake facilitator protein n=1 Tax=Promicromonospora sukumoe TaxID=88382 RepID=A0A7W3JEF8_9MICO|nr:MIP/aquaporin family protein [Promicromonospora sukumoe]MBA8811279.1 glycerol uptake facilitator protein [Promicromonospora sukumoe]
MNAFTDIMVPEFLGTMILLLGGAGVVANAILPKNKGFNGGWLMINFGWGLAVFAGVFVSLKSGAHINPAVTLGILTSGAEEFAPGVAADFPNMLIYWGSQLVGAFVGAVLAYLAYKRHFDEDADPAVKLGVFSTGPAIRSYGWNFVTEVIGTFMLVFVILSFANWPGDLGPLAAALLVTGIGASLGGPTGYAINPARDFGPRIAHFVLPIPGKGSSDWAYSWVPVLGPLAGGALGGLLAAAVAA